MGDTNALLRIGFTAAGYVIGGGPIGGAIGGAVGGALFPPDQAGIEGPRPRNTGLTTSEYGTPIPIVLGTGVVDGQVIDGADQVDIVRKKESGGGKGGGKGPSVTTYEAFATFALLFAEVPRRGMTYKVRRLWWNSQLVYDRRPAIREEAPEAEQQNLGFFGGGGIFSLTGGVNSGLDEDAANTGGLVWAYLGGQVQTLDIPNGGAISVDSGSVALTDNATNYVYFNKADFSVAVSTIGFPAGAPRIREVVVVSGVQTQSIDRRVFVNEQRFFNRQAKSDTIESYLTLYDGSEDQQPDPVLEAIHGPGNVPGYQGFCYAVFDGLPVTDEGGLIGNWEAELVLEGTADNELPELIRGKVLYDWGFGTDPRNPRNQHDVVAVQEPFGGSLYEHGWNFALTDYGPLYSDQPGDSVKRVYFYRNSKAAGIYFGTAPPYSSSYEPALSWGAISQAGKIGLGIQLPLVNDEPPPPPEGLQYIGKSTDLQSARYAAEDDIDYIERVPYYPETTCELPYVEIPEAPQWCINIETGNILPNAPFGVVSGSFVAASAYDADATTVFEYPADPVLRTDSPFNNEAFWTSLGIPGEYGVDYPVEIGEAAVAQLNVNAVSGNPIALSLAIELIAEQVGVSADRIDASHLTDQFWGMVIRGGTARNYLEALRSWAFIDTIESEGLVKFPRRGADPVLAVDADDIGLDNQPRLSSRRQEDFELPSLVRVNYPALNSDYEAGQQSARRRVTPSENILDIDVTVATTDEHAARIAQVVLNDAWRARNARDFSAFRRYDQLEPSDVITLDLDGVSYRLRLLEKTYNNGVTFRAVDDGAAEYTPEVVAATVSGGSEIEPLVGVTNLLLLDLPPLKDGHNSPSYYVASWGVTPSWAGALIESSDDGGATYAERATITDSATVGVLITAPNTARSTLPDYGSRVEVQMLSGDLFGVADLAFRNGTANTVAIGNQGRWLIVSFRDVAQLANGNLELSVLLQGRLGTERNIGNVFAGDYLVLLDDSLARIEHSAAATGTGINLRASSIGGGVATLSTAFTPSAINLKPFAPVHIRTAYNDAGDLSITWTRRTRLGGGWQLFPLYEDAEQYELDFVTDDADQTVVATKTLTLGIGDTRPIYNYSAAAQSSDGIPGSFILRIYQISAVVGRGFVGEVTI